MLKTFLRCIVEACIGFLGYRIFAILLPGIWDTIHFSSRIWDTVFNILVTFRDIEYLGELIMRIFASL